MNNKIINPKTNNMRKTFPILAVFFIFGLFVSCERHISADKLPQKAQTFLNQHFPSINVISVKKDGFQYEVNLMDGTSLEFNHSGKWTKVDCQMRPVPDGIVPASIQTYVTTNFTPNYIIKIKQERREYEVELSNDLELKFDKNGIFMYAD